MRLSTSYVSLIIISCLQLRFFNSIRKNKKKQIPKKYYNADIAVAAHFVPMLRNRRESLLQSLLFLNGFAGPHH